MGIIKTYSLKETAEYLEVSTRTIQNYLKAGELEGKKIGRSWKIPEDSINDLLTRGTRYNYTKKLKKKDHEEE